MSFFNFFKSFFYILEKIFFYQEYHKKNNFLPYFDQNNKMEKCQIFYENHGLTS